MARPRQRHRVRRHVHHRIDNGDEHAPADIAGHGPVHLAEHAGRGIETQRDLLEVGAAGRHEQRGRDALAGHVGHGDAEPGWTEDKKIVEVPADLLRGNVLCRHVQSGEARRRRRQQHLLDAAREREIKVELPLFNLETQGLEVVHG